MISNNLTVSEIRYFQKKILRAASDIYSHYEWRTTKNRFHALTIEILLQRTAADQVLPVYTDFISKYKTPEEFIHSPENIFKSLGLIWRYKIFINLCSHLINLKHIPDSREELLRLPGVGTYVASAFRSLHSEQRDFIIDSNIVRLYGRYFGFETDGETRRKKWFIELADRLTPAKKFKEYNYGLLDFTRQICKNKPDCAHCLLIAKCYYPRFHKQNINNL